MKLGGYKKSFYIISLMHMLLLMTSCVRDQPQIIIVTATNESQSDNAIVITTPLEQNINTPNPTTLPSTSPRLTLIEPASPSVLPTPNASQPIDANPVEHTVQAGETLSLIAQRYNLTLESIMATNAIPNPNILSVGQVLTLPDASASLSPSIKLISDNQLIRGPGSNQFDINGFISSMPGYIRLVTDQVETNDANGIPQIATLTSSQIIERVALEYSINPRIILAFLEYRAGWLSNATVNPELTTHPLISISNSINVDRAGLYRQASWLANQLNFGYYGFKYGYVRTIEAGTTTLRLNPELNPGTASIYYVLSRYTSFDRWQFDTSYNGFYATYYRFFDNPLSFTVDPITPNNLQQPPLSLPFELGNVWFHTGGPHGGWGSGSAWSAIDFAPPDERDISSPFCFTSEFWLTAVAPGVVTRAQNGALVLDLDSDGDESTGWSILYLHLDDATMISSGTRVMTGQRIGQASCAGGFSNATHLHIARRYNGEWIPTDCSQCRLDISVPIFNMSGWNVIGLTGQEYQGYIERDGIQVIAAQGREILTNRIALE